MDNTTEKRSFRRFAPGVRVEIRVHGRSGWRGQGDLLDCSAAGVGFCMPEGVKGGAVVLLRVDGPWPREVPETCREAGPFHMVTAKVRWCREIPASPPGALSVFRIGAKRMLPVH